MGHCGEGVSDHYQLVEGEVEGLFWINRGSVTDMGVATIFIEPSKVLDTMFIPGPERRALWKWKTKSSECFVLAFQKQVFIRSEVCLERIFPEKLWNIPNNTTFCNVLKVLFFAFVSAIYIASPLCAAINRWQSSYLPINFWK